MTEHLPSGVRAYHGDNPIPFSEAHRRCLPRDFYKMDIDAVLSTEGHIETEGSTFHEYVMSRGRSATVAVFDLKETAKAIFCNHNDARHRYQVGLCRALGIAQPVAPVFAYVVGDGPFDVYRVDLDSCDVDVTPVTLPSHSSWLPQFEELGITEVRSTLCAWINGEHKAKEMLLIE